MTILLRLQEASGSGGKGLGGVLVGWLRSFRYLLGAPTVICQLGTGSLADHFNSFCYACIDATQKGQLTWLSYFTTNNYWLSSSLLWSLSPSSASWYLAWYRILASSNCTLLGDILDNTHMRKYAISDNILSTQGCVGE